jgi:ubiquinone biosynthesis accessory factor UbiJ
MLKSLAYTAFEEALNLYLDLDADAKAQLARLHGRVIALEVLGVGVTLYLVPAPTRLQVLSRCDGVPDCTLRGSPLALARLREPERGSDGLFAGEVEIHGDTELAHRFGKILGRIDIDWEEQLSRLTGDVVAHELGNVARGARRWGRQAKESLTLDLREYLQEETRILPNRWEIEDFLAGVDRVRDDVERLEARLDRLERRLAGEGKAP